MSRQFLNREGSSPEACIGGEEENCATKEGGININHMMLLWKFLSC